MSGEQACAVASDLLSLIDFNVYSAKDWAQFFAALLAVAAYTYGLWKAYRFSKAQIAKRLIAYLDGDREFISRRVMRLFGISDTARPRQRKRSIRSSTI
jgi:hypothetical protein